MNGFVLVSKFIVPAFVLTYIIDFTYSQRAYDFLIKYYESYLTVFYIYISLSVLACTLKYAIERQWLPAAGSLIGGVALSFLLVMAGFAIACTTGNCL